MKLSYLILLLAFIPVLFSCNQPNQVASTEDEDLTLVAALLDRQSTWIIGKNCQKTATINDNNEQQTMMIDSTFFKTDLRMINGEVALSFGHLTYQKTMDEDNTISYKTKDDNTNGPQLLKIQKDSNGAILSIEMTEEKVNYLHQTHLAILLTFDPALGYLKSYAIKGAQQIIGMDAIPFEIIGVVN